MIKKKLKRMFKNRLWRGSIVVLLGSIFASAFSYLYHFITGRLLNPSQYGLLESLIALSYFLVVFTQAFSFAVVNSLSDKKEKQVLPIVCFLEKKAALISIMMWFIFMALYPSIKSFLHLPTFSIYLVFSLQALLSFIPAVYMATLQARLRFVSFSLFTVLGGISKVIFALIFIKLGWQAIGAIGAMSSQNIFLIILGFYLIRHFWQKLNKNQRLKVDLKKSFWSFLTLSVITNLSLVSLYASDVLLVRHYFSSHWVGIYSAGAVLSKIIFFGASAVLMVAFPLFSKYKNNLTKLKKIFLFSVSYIVLGSIVGIAVFSLFPQLLVNLLYGNAYQEVSSLLPSLAIFISLAALFNLFIQFLLALRKKSAAVLAFLTALTQLLLIVYRHPTINMVIINSIISLSIGIVLGSVLILKELAGARQKQQIYV